MLHADAIESGNRLSHSNQARTLLHLLAKPFSDDVNDVSGVHGNILKLRVEGYGLRRGNRPGRRRPDYGVNISSSQRGVDGVRVTGKFVADIHAGRSVLFVLNFGLGQCGLVVYAPENRFQAFINKVLLKERIEGLENARFVLEGHRLIWIRPAAKDAESLKLRALQVDVLLSVFTAGAANADCGHLQLLAAKLLVYLDLDRQAMAVPAWNVRRIKARHRLGLDDKVLDALVQRMTKVNCAVGVGRAIVQDVLRRPISGYPDLMVKVLFHPACEPRRLILRQVCLHRKVGLGQVQGRLQRLFSGDADVGGGFNFGHARSS